MRHTHYVSAASLGRPSRKEHEREAERVERMAHLASPRSRVRDVIAGVRVRHPKDAEALQSEVVKAEGIITQAKGVLSDLEKQLAGLEEKGAGLRAKALQGNRKAAEKADKILAEAGDLARERDQVVRAFGSLQIQLLDIFARVAGQAQAIHEAELAELDRDLDDIAQEQRRLQATIAELEQKRAPLNAQHADASGSVTNTEYAIDDIRNGRAKIEDAATVPA